MASITRPLCRYFINKPPNFLHISKSRCFSCHSTVYSKKPEVKPPGKITMMAEKKYLGFMARFESGLERRYPKAHKLYILVKQGVKDFFVDTKTLYRVSTEMWRGKKPTEMTYNELECYRQMPADLWRVGPVVILLNIPVTDMIMPIFVYLFPRHLLCRHFWTAEQMSDFNLHYLKSRAPHFIKVLHYMESHSKEVDDPGLRRLLNDLIHTLERGQQPSVEHIVEVKPVFLDKQPFGREHLASRHKLLTRHLALGLNLSTLSPSRMSQQAWLLHHIDLALSRDGMTSLDKNKLLQACFLRGLNASGLAEEDMISYLTRWTQISKITDEGSLSLLLHSPVLLALNHPANSSLVSTR